MRKISKARVGSNGLYSAYLQTIFFKLVGRWWKRNSAGENVRLDVSRTWHQADFNYVWSAEPALAVYTKIFNQVIPSRLKTNIQKLPECLHKYRCGVPLAKYAYCEVFDRSTTEDLDAFEEEYGFLLPLGNWKDSPREVFGISDDRLEFCYKCRKVLTSISLMGEDNNWKTKFQL